MTPAQARKQFQQRLKALTAAASSGNIKTMQTLLDEDPTLLKQDVPLFEACLQGQVEAVTLLLDAGASPNALPSADGNMGRRPLTRVIRRTRAIPWTPQHRQVLLLLLDRGADTAAQPSWEGSSALGVAASANNQEAIDILLERGELIDIFHAAALADTARVAQFLKDEPDLATALSAGNSTALQFCAHSALGEDNPAVAQQLAEIADMLLVQGAPLDPADMGPNTTYSALQLASRVGNDSVIGVLLKHGADPDEVLHLALENQRMPILDLLSPLRDTLNLNYRADNKLQNPMLNELIRNGKLQSAHWLLDQGADPNQQDLNGFTALHYAARRGVNNDLLGALLEQDADISMPDNDGNTPLEIAKQRKKTKVIAFLERH